MLFEKLGYHLSQASIEEAERDWRINNQNEEGLRFEDVLHVLNTIRSREGFAMSEVVELNDVFHRHDMQGCQQLREFELARALAWLGYPLSLHQRQELWCRVDVDKTGSLEAGEFLKLMRLLREEEAMAAQALLKRNAGGLKVAEKDLQNTLATLGYAPSHAVLNQAVMQALGDKVDRKPDLQSILTIFRCVREASVAKLRQSAGLSDLQTSKIRARFGSRIDQGKLIKNIELEKFMYELFPAARHSHEERVRVRQSIAEHHGEDNGLVTLDDVFAIIRKYRDTRDEAGWEREQDVIESTGFSNQLVAQFKEAFVRADHHGHGFLAGREISSVFDEILDMNQPDIGPLLKEIARLCNRVECIDFSEFLRLVKVTWDLRMVKNL
eukprot:gnl/TRDRNA2_/TRDRNA2_177042_c0_seq7.p1 gnl/TRDRNA2_/TRDRNA2_177042_c0~~gnl/TRDRNA2_/TRDRNA2_177042_c0_seq7.p1  ORF type:complete len:383 (+),score=89.47 gnl/TRDRNA2_/TRDRNA2_177042_c0_seq7:353-1501(+)